MNYFPLTFLIDLALKRAYSLSKRIRNLHIHYSWYQTHASEQSDKLKSIVYMETILQEYRQSIYIWMFVLRFCMFMNYPKNLKLGSSDPFFNEVKDNNLMVTKQILWIQKVLDEIEALPHNKINRLMNTSGQDKSWTYSTTNKRSYESIGLIPRSITRTFSRFQSELMSRSRLLIISEYRLLKYQAIASLQYLIAIICICWASSNLLKWFFFSPSIQSSWIGIGDFLFLNSFQEEQALLELKTIEDLVWFDSVLQYSPQIPLQNWVLDLEDHIIVLLHMYNDAAVEIIFNLINSLWLLICLVMVLVLGQKRLAIVNSWLQELFYSLSDTMKAFCIILAKDLCIGFHSPHGWEILIGSTVDHFGFAHNPYILSFVVSTLPVVIDTILKYWIFRHLNRISPSIVVTYHTMNE
jgi:hypothetical protein